MLTLTTLGTFAGVTTVTAAVYSVIAILITPAARRWAILAIAECVVCGGGLLVGPLSASRILVLVLNGFVAAASAAGALHVIKGSLITPKGKSRA